MLALLACASVARARQAASGAIDVNASSPLGTPVEPRFAMTSNNCNKMAHQHILRGYNNTNKRTTGGPAIQNGATIHSTNGVATTGTVDSKPDETLLLHVILND